MNLKGGLITAIIVCTFMASWMFGFEKGLFAANYRSIANKLTASYVPA